jgi:CheY-like chemotaxis protein
MKLDSAESAEEIIDLAESAAKSGRSYDAVFLSYSLKGKSAASIAKKLKETVDPGRMVIIASFLEWSKIEPEASSLNISRFVSQPFFPSNLLTVINAITSQELKGPEPAGEEKTETPDYSGLRLLLAEDIEINREIFLALLEPTGIVIDTADNGRKAAEKFQSSPDKYDIIIMDIQMPEMNGFEATRAIRAFEKKRNQETGRLFRPVPIVAMTANAFKADIEQCLASGMNDHLTKPIDEKAVIKKIGKYCLGR